MRGVAVNTIDWSDIKARHRLADVARRSGLEVGGAGRIMISCPTPSHLDSNPSTQLDLDHDRYRCFGCGAHGDVIDWVRDIEGVDTAAAVAILQSRRPINAVFASGTPHLRRPAQHADSPRLDRTLAARVAEANHVAWNYYSHGDLHERGVTYLAGRGIDIAALEAETGAPVVGHTPSAKTPIAVLVGHLADRGFSEDELIDAGLATRLADGCVIDFFRDRVILPVRDATGAIIGLLGRDTTARSQVKYLNPPTTATYKKSLALYRPIQPSLQPDGAVIVCEGPLDALSIAAHAAAAGVSDRFAPLAACGRVLSDHQLNTILAQHPRAPVLAADGDTAGREANLNWARRMLVKGRETVITNLPDGNDPASWLAARGTAGLAAVTRRGCLEDRSGALRPSHCGVALTRADFADCDSYHPPDRDEFARTLAKVTVALPLSARRRYQAAAASVFALLVDGRSTGSSWAAADSQHPQVSEPERIHL
jgi:DNA primase